MTLRSYAFALGCTLSLCAVAGCAKVRMQAGTDGATHFLVECDADAECGELSCLCGVCSTSCSEDAQCSDLNDQATCLTGSAMSCGAAEKSCAVECDGDADCSGSGAGARCSAGACIRPATPSTPDAGTPDATVANGDAGPRGCGAMEARSNGDDCVGVIGFTWNGGSCVTVDCGCEGSQCDELYATPSSCELAHAACAPPCSRMDAKSNGTECAAIPGFTWNGVECEPIVCGCTGSDCGSIYADQAECEAQHRECAPLTMCSQPSDCMLAGEDCCTCDVAGRDDITSISTAQSQAHADRTCVPGQACPDCPSDPFAGVALRYAATCEPSTRWEGGECALLDLSALPCTSDVGCRLEVRNCCECGASTLLENLLSVPNGLDLTDAICAPTDASCCGIGFVIREGVIARCGSAGYCELVED
jgi:hypothetical protein